MHTPTCGISAPRRAAVSANLNARLTIGFYDLRVAIDQSLGILIIRITGYCYFYPSRNTGTMVDHVLLSSTAKARISRVEEGTMGLLLRFAFVLLAQRPLKFIYAPQKLPKHISRGF